MLVSLGLVLVAFLHGGSRARRSLRARMSRLLAALAFGLAATWSVLAQVSSIRAGGLILLLAAMLIPRPCLAWLRDVDAAWLPLFTAGVLIATAGHFYTERDAFVHAIARGWDIEWHARYDGLPSVGKAGMREVTALPLVPEHATPTRWVTIEPSGRVRVEGHGHEVLVIARSGATAQTIASAIAKVRRPNDRFAVQVD